MFQRIKTFLKAIDGSIWFYLLLLAVSLFVLRFTFFVHPDTSGDFWGNVRVEFVGFCFDVLLLGLIFSIFMQRYQRKQDIKRWQEEIDDYREWNEPEAMFRIVGNIKRLSRLGVTEIDLQHCFLEESNLGGLNLSGSIFSGARMEHTFLAEAELENAFFHWTNLSRANLIKANLKGAFLKYTVLEDAILFDIQLDGAYISNVVLEGASVKSGTWFDDLKKNGVEGVEWLKEHYDIIPESDHESLYIIKRKKKTAPPHSTRDGAVNLNSPL